MRKSDIYFIYAIVTVKAKLSCLENSKVIYPGGTVCNTIAATNDSIIDIIAVVERSDEVLNTIDVLKNIVNEYNNGIDAFSLTLFINHELYFLKQHGNNIDSVISSVAEDLENHLAPEMFWDHALDNLLLLLQGQYPTDDTTDVEDSYSYYNSKPLTDKADISTDYDNNLYDSYYNRKRRSTSDIIGIENMNEFAEGIMTNGVYKKTAKYVILLPAPGKDFHRSMEKYIEETIDKIVIKLRIPIIWLEKGSTYSKIPDTLHIPLNTANDVQCELMEHFCDFAR